MGQSVEVPVSDPSTVALPKDRETTDRKERQNEQELRKTNFSLGSSEEWLAAQSIRLIGRELVVS